MQGVILAGGLATRLRPITNKIPKSMIKIKNKPFLEYQIELLRRNDINEIILCVGYLGEQIEDYFGNGKKFGVNIKYSYENEQLLGTGGAIRNTLDLLSNYFFVLYGDSYLNVNHKEIYNYFLKINYPVLLVIYKNNNKWDRSNVVFKDGIVEIYDKNNCIPEMEFIDYGLSILSKRIVKRIPKNVKYDLANLYKGLSVEKKLAGYEALERFYEIGSKNGLREFENYIKGKGNNHDYH